ncbi:hypothetical protein J3R30DRAFT_3703948 [Lentinula aciculospora]|uniref:Uncharacterized protein n=1 Tax=Lentinula aciculospora TaxID=153920 RepID=A0A9W9AAH4_9AGAR|nr:hypothetical protein J3R30DRAFT_3703948 [Lentinula aciculospora]
MPFEFSNVYLTATVARENEEGNPTLGNISQNPRFISQECGVFLPHIMLELRMNPSRSSLQDLTSKLKICYLKAQPFVRAVSVKDWATTLLSCTYTAKVEANKEVDEVKDEHSASPVAGPSSLPEIGSLSRSTLGVSYLLPGSFVSSSSISNLGGLTDVKPDFSAFIDGAVNFQTAPSICEPSVPCPNDISLGTSPVNPIVIDDDDDNNDDERKVEEFDDLSVRDASLSSFATSMASPPRLSLFPLKRNQSDTDMPMQKRSKIDRNCSNSTQLSESESQKLKNDIRRSTSSIPIQPKAYGGSFNFVTERIDVDADEEGRRMSAELEALHVCYLASPKGVALSRSFLV